MLKTIFISILLNGSPANIIPTQDSVGLVEAVSLWVGDETEGNCLTNKDSIESSVRLIFEQSGIPVEATENYSLRHPLVLMNFVGYEVTNTRGLGLGCVVSFGVTINYPSIHTVFVGESTHLIGIVGTHRQESNLFSGPNNVNAEALEAAEHHARNFAADILRARRSSNVRALRNPSE